MVLSWGQPLQTIPARAPIYWLRGIEGQSNSAIAAMLVKGAVAGLLAAWAWLLRKGAGELPDADGGGLFSTHSCH